MNISEAQAKAIAIGKLNEIGSKEDKFNPPYDSVLEQVFEVWGQEFIKAYQSYLQQEKLMASRDLYQGAGFKITVKGDNIIRFTLFAPNHLKYVDKGRAPGKRPPIKPIMEWIAHKGIPVRKSNAQSGKSVLEAARGLAISISWAIAKKGTIKRYGYKGADIIDNILPQSEIDKLSKALSAAVGKTIVLSIGFPEK